MIEIDNWIDNLQHPFFMAIAGIVAFFALKYSLWVSSESNGNINSFADFWEDQKDEMVVTLIFTMIFLIWDDETLSLWYEFVEDETPEKARNHELAPAYYLLVGVAVERIYWIIQKLRK